MSSNQLVAEATLALETCRRLLPPGLYFFAPEVVDGKLTGAIVEKREDYSSKEEEERDGVTFGFWPLGFVPDDLKSRPTPEWLYKYPFVGEVSKLSQAPDAYLVAVTQHVNHRIECRTAKKD